MELLTLLRLPQCIVNKAYVAIERNRMIKVVFPIMPTAAFLLSLCLSLIPKITPAIFTPKAIIIAKANKDACLAPSPNCSQKVEASRVRPVIMALIISSFTVKSLMSP